MKMIIMCGLPGCGKSTAAQLLLDEATKAGKTAVICSTDSFMIVDGVYLWNADKLGWAHRQCEAKAQQACKDKTDLVIVDNTNLLRRSRKPYLKMARQNDYEVEIKVIGTFDDDFVRLCTERNTHAVPLASIQKMAHKAQIPKLESCPSCLFQIKKPSR